MLYKPVYLKPGEKQMHPPESLIPMGRPAPSPPPMPQAPPTPPIALPVGGYGDEAAVGADDGDEGVKRLPMLIARWKIVVPPEATRDVLSGRVPYLLVENEGITVFKPVHVFAALKLRKETVVRLEDYGCVGAHERFLERKPKKREGLGYRRKYLSPELVGRGIFISFRTSYFQLSSKDYKFRPRIIEELQQRNSLQKN